MEGSSQCYLYGAFRLEYLHDVTRGFDDAPRKGLILYIDQKKIQKRE